MSTDRTSELRAAPRAIARRMVLVATLSILVQPIRAAESALLSPHALAVTELISDLVSPNAPERATAAENLGYLRAYEAAGVLGEALADESPTVRREACLSLAWCGGRSDVPVLLDALGDDDWMVRQAAWVALTNLSGMEFPFAADADTDTRKAQQQRWREWWEAIPETAAPPELIALLDDLPRDLAAGCVVSASTTYKGPPSVLTDSSLKGFWQTKNVGFPQHCTIDLGRPRTIGCVVVTQYGEGFRLTDYALSVSDDGETYRELQRQRGITPTDLVISFPQTKARHVRITSHGSERPVYPTTFHRVSVFADASSARETSSRFLLRERAMRALGCLGGDGACQPVLETIRPYLKRGATGTEEKLMVQAGIRALGRMQEVEARDLLIGLLSHPQWARYAADALGDFGGSFAARALIEAYPRYALSVAGKEPAALPRDDRPGFEAVDRMYETPYAIALAMCRTPLRAEAVLLDLHGIADLLVASMAGDFDGAMLYEEQAFQRVTAHLLECADLRRDVCELAFEAVGEPSFLPSAPRLSPDTRARLLALAKSGPGGTSRAATWLTALCREKDDLPRLLRLLDHDNGWVRINAAKTLMFIGDQSAVDPIAAKLQASQPEATFGFLDDFLFKQKKHQGQDEYNAPSPCWREAFTRALGALGDNRHVPLLIDLLNDERNVLEVRYSAAASLAQIGTPDALGALQVAASGHPFHSIRLLAREALWKRDLAWASPVASKEPTPDPPVHGTSTTPEAIVFIKGSNDMPNDFQIDIWRQAYSTTDSGPTYRIGKNLYLLQPPTKEGAIRPLTNFRGGYVADCEVSWDGTHVIFARREEGNPWWHLYELELAGGAPRQLTSGPYHDVQPAYLPDGRVVFSSSRIGLRDEYHGYPATGLTVMNRDGSNLRCIGFSLGRDNEPSVMPDGRILFSRLELFYSRLKTELTVQTMLPDGTMNRTIYGPEKRDLWRQVTRDSGEKGWGEAPPRHRVLRLTQPQPLDDERVLVATTGGATILGPGRMNEHILPRHDNMAVTSPFPLDDDTALCAATLRTRDRKKVDLGLYGMDVNTGALSLIYNDPACADFEPRPVMRRARPHALPASSPSNVFTGTLLCASTRTTREALTRERGKLVRIIEGQPVTSRHHTHTSSAGQAWKNHVGTHARVLGTVPLASDGSFHVEIPADRLVHCQVLDSDRRVVGNQLIWMSARPGETKSCVGCHEMPDTAGVSLDPAMPIGAKYPPIKCLPTGNEFSYRAKAWKKGTLPDEAEERTRTVNAVSLPGRM